jgi:hypothetical protein
MADTLPTSKAPKLRASCEGCGTAKVRCDRGQPKCSRCVALGLTCVYGISRKFGKPPRKRPSACLDVSNGFLHAKRVTRGAQSCENHITMGLEQSPSVNKPAQPQLSSSDPQTDILPLPSGLNSTASIQSCDNRTTIGAMKSQTAKEAALLKTSDLAIDVLSVPSHINNTSSIYEQNQLDSNFITPLPLDEWAEFDIWGPSLEFPSFSNDSRLPNSASEPVNNLSASFDSPESHSCPRGSYELFRDLICPSPFLHAPEANVDTVSARLDEVLHFNSDAINRLRLLLKCPCAKSGHRIMVHASIISRILIWYQQAAGCTGSSSLDSRPSAVAASSPSGSASSSSPPPSWVTADHKNDTASPPTLVQSTGFAVAQVPVSMGTFNIEDENMQDAFRNQLVLSELRKAANVIDLFTSQHSGECSDNGVAGLYSHLGIWLRSEHTKTVRMLRARLGTLNKTLGVDKGEGEGTL